MDSYAELKQMSNILLRWWWILVAGVIVGAGLGYGMNQSQPKVYEASASIMVGEFIQAPQITRDDITARDTFVQGYADLARRQLILDKVIDALELDVSWQQLKGRVTVVIADNGQMIEITAEANTTEVAEKIVGEIANQLILLSPVRENFEINRSFAQAEIESLQSRIEAGHQKLESLYDEAGGKVSAERLIELKTEIDTMERLITDWESTYARLLNLIQPGASQNSLTLVDEPRANTNPIAPITSLNLLVGVMIGAMLALASIFFMDQLDGKVRFPDVLKRRLGLTPLGKIKNRATGKNFEQQLITAQQFASPQADSYRLVLSNIGFGNKGERSVKSLLITSPQVVGEKSVTASNLGVILALSGYKTILVDGNWKNAIQDRIFNVEVTSGFMDLLSNPHLKPKDHLHATSIENLQLLAVGKLPDNPMGVFQRKRIGEIIVDLAKVADVVILDAPSIIDADALKLSGVTDGVALVMPGSASRESVRQAMASLQLAGGKLLGGILI